MDVPNGMGTPRKPIPGASLYQDDLLRSDRVPGLHAIKVDAGRETRPIEDNFREIQAVFDKALSLKQRP